MTRHYLFLGKHTIEEWRELAKTSHAARFERLIDQAKSYVNYLPPDEHPSDSITYIGMAAANLSLAYLLTQEQQFLDTVIRWVNIGIGYPHWGKERMPDHDLDAAWLLFGFGLCYDWLNEFLPTDFCQRLRDKLILQAQRLYDFAVDTEGEWWSSAYWQNHNWICYGGLATAAYALSPDIPEATQWAQRAQKNFEIALPLMADDGSDYEGPVYWRYGFMWFLIYAHVLQEQTGVNLHDSDFLRYAFDFRLYLSAPNLINTANIGDCHDRRSAHSAAVNYRLASLYNIGVAQWLTDEFYRTGEWAREGREGLVKPGVLPEAWLEFVWYDPDIKPVPLDLMPLVRTFPDMGIVSMRTSWQPDACYMLFKCGSPSGHKGWHYGHVFNALYDWQTISAGHAHPDENSFILINGEDYLCVDEGYSKAKMTYHHSTLLVDGHGQYAEGEYNIFHDLDAGWGGRLEDVFHLGTSVYMRGEAARAYAAHTGLQQFTRQMLFLDGHLIVLYDHIKSNHSTQFAWMLQTDNSPESKNDQTFLIKNGNSQMQVHVLTPDPVVWDDIEREITANPTSAKPDWIIRRVQHALTLTPIEKTQATNYFVVFNLGDWRVQSLDCYKGSAMLAEHGNNNYIVGFSQDKSGISIAALIESDAAWLSVHRDNATVTQVLAGDVTHIWIEGVLYFLADMPVSVWYDGTKWLVRANHKTWISYRSAQGELSLSRQQIDAGETVIHVE